MLACVRRLHGASPPRLLFNQRRAYAGPPSKGPNQALGVILSRESHRESHREPPVKLTSTPYPARQILFPNDLVYKNALQKQKIYKKPSVAPGPEITRHRDTFHQFDLDPRHFTNNGAVLSHFVTEMGKIKSRDQTGLTLKSQRLMGRTIRRSKMMGIIPTLSKGYKRFF